MTEMVRLDRLAKRFGPVHAVEEVSFTAARGEVLGFLGPNGAGKTTTMRIITGYMPSTDGTVKVDGFDVADQPLEVRRRIGYLPENPPLYPEMTVIGYLKFVAKLKGAGGSKVQDEVNRAMEKVNLGDVQGRIISKLSKGYKQRVGIAQALLNDPPVLILDEPTIGLDPKQIHEVRELIKGLAHSHTVVLSTHILPEVEQTCHRVIIIDKGKIVAVDTPQNLRSQIQGVARVFIEVEGPSDDILAAVKSVPGVADVRVVSQTDGRSSLHVDGESGRDIRTDVARTVVNGGWGLLALQAENMSLEDIFIKLTTAEETTPTTAS
jgi:gliding motility-associated transport system ATP-binding protein